MDFETVKVTDYEAYIGAQTVDRLARKAERLQGASVVHINSTPQGGGVAEILASLTLLMNSLGIRTDWQVITGPPEFYSITKEMHNALQGGEIELTGEKKFIYEQVAYENSIVRPLEQDFAVVHDPQPLPLIRHYQKKGPWVWRCHVDLSTPNQELWPYLSSFVEDYDTVIMSIKEYAQALKVPQVFFMPAIDPFSSKNRELAAEEIDATLSAHGIPTDLPLVVQVSRFDRWKDPEGVIRAFQAARREVPSTLVLLGNMAADDPEGQEVLTSLLRHQEERILIKCVSDATLVNALQRRAAVVLQKSLREGFGLTVTEAMWKGTPVIGGNVGGIPAQILDGVNGFLVNSVAEAAEKMVLLLKDEALRREMGGRARESARRRFLMPRLLEQYLDLFNFLSQVSFH